MGAEQIQVKRLANDVSADHSRWDSFVHAQQAGTFYHLSPWQRVIQRSFGHVMHMLYVEQDGEITGVLPLGYIKSKIFGRSLISVPFCVYGGVIATDHASRLALEAEARQLAQQLNVGYVEYRNIDVVEPDRPAKRDLYVTFRKTISVDMEENLLAIPRKQRAVVRKGIKAGLISELDTSADRLYEAYSESVRNLGTPVFSKRYFEVLLEEFAGSVDIVSITSAEGELLSSVMNFYFRDEVLPYYGGGTAAARGKYANDFMYYDVMSRAVERGCTVFDYGRSKEGTGSYRFKKHWGFEPEPLSYEYDLVNATEIPNISPANPKYKLMVDTWQKLPLWLSRRIGPLVAKDLA